VATFVIEIITEALLHNSHCIEQQSIAKNKNPH